MRYARHMLMMGSGGRNSGKTTFACRLIGALCAHHPITAAKVTTIRERDGSCPRGGEGCGVCAALEGHYCITEETLAGTEKDTQRLLAAGARRVFWLRVAHEHLEEGAAALLDVVDPEDFLICESNSLRTVVEPEVFLLFHHRDASEVKASARAVDDHADRVVCFDGREFDLAVDDAALCERGWAVRHRATAIVLAGGKSERMGQDKALLRVDGQPLIAHICAQLAPHFDEVLVSTSTPEQYGFLDVKRVPDKAPGAGPLMGIASALEVSRHDLNLVAPCDMPRIDLRLMRRMLREARHYDAVIPVSAAGDVQPLFAVYSKRALPIVNAALAEGQRSVKETFKRCRVKYLEISEPEALRNLNTRDEFARFVGRETEAVSGDTV
jgi:molybdenum cofactor guanylyltransferase